MKFITLDFPLLTTHQGGDRKLDKIQRSSNRGRGDKLWCSCTCKIAESTAHDAAEGKPTFSFMEVTSYALKRRLCGDANRRRV